jgi:N-acetylmuramic acid 6-phosphate etherase
MSTLHRQNALAKAEDFINNETQYHLGFLPVEQPNPKTAHLDLAFSRSIAEGVNMLQSVDRDLTTLIDKALSDKRFTKMKDAMVQSLSQNKRIIFSGCGATGRLSILLEAAYRDYFKRLQNEQPVVYSRVSDLSDSVISIMTGGDYALIRSVEFFEDYLEFGRQQVRELGIGKGDMLVAITATGETTSILGTVMESAQQEADVFLLICVAQEVPKSRLDRVREAYAHPRVTVLDMPCGPLALTGSTRMQSTTLEQMIAGAALETAMMQVIQERVKDKASEKWLSLFDRPINHAKGFSGLLDALEQPESVEAIASYIEFEEGIYRKDGLITYFADDFILDILSDTTERSPTFMLPPFCKCDDLVSPLSWAFVKNPSVSTPEAWYRCLSRRPRCLNWKQCDYDRMEVSNLVKTGIPKIGDEELMKFNIGNEAAPRRLETEENAAVWIGREKAGKEFEEEARLFRRKVSLLISPKHTTADFLVPYEGTKTPLRILEHLSVKLVMNIVSTGTMVRMGRVTGNWMSWLDASNKKLIDRSTRIIADQCHVSYRVACRELYLSIEKLDSIPDGAVRLSPAQYTIQRLQTSAVKNKFK